VVIMANSRDTQCSSCCASALYALSWHSHSSPKVMDHTVIQALNDMCDSDSLETRKRCVATLWSLTLQPGKSEDPAVSIPALLSLLRKEADHDMMRLCSAALCNLAVDINNCQRMLDEGAVVPIIALCSSDNISTKIQCGAILCRLASEPKNRQQLISPDYIRVLLSLAKVEDRLTQQRGVIALVHMSQEPEARRFLLAQNALLGLVQLSNKPDELIRRGCAAVLCNLAYQEGSEVAIVECGAVSCLLIIALVATDNEATKTTCAKAIFNLLHAPKTHKHMIDDGIVWGFATLSKTPQPSVTRICATVFCNLSIDFPSDVLAASSARAIFELMKSPDPETAKLATRALTNLLSNTCHSDQHARFKPSAVPVLIDALQAPGADPEMALLSARCLTYISVTAAGRSAIIANDALKALGFDLVGRGLVSRTCMLTEGSPTTDAQSACSPPSHEQGWLRRVARPKASMLLTSESHHPAGDRHPGRGTGLRCNARQHLRQPQLAQPGHHGRLPERADRAVLAGAGGRGHQHVRHTCALLPLLRGREPRAAGAGRRDRGGVGLFATAPTRRAHRGAAAAERGPGLQPHDAGRPAGRADAAGGHQVHAELLVGQPHGRHQGALRAGGLPPGLRPRQLLAPRARRHHAHAHPPGGPVHRGAGQPQPRDHG
jgi:hypothetical protein